MSKSIRQRTQLMLPVVPTLWKTGNSKLVLSYRLKTNHSGLVAVLFYFQVLSLGNSAIGAESVVPRSVSENYVAGENTYMQSYKTA